MYNQPPTSSGSGGGQNSGHEQNRMQRRVSYNNYQLPNSSHSHGSHNGPGNEGRQHYNQQYNMRDHHQDLEEEQKLGVGGYGYDGRGKDYYRQDDQMNKMYDD